MCGALTASGSPCRVTTNLRAGLCVFHDPQRVEEARAMRAKGGRANRKRTIKTVGTTELPPLPATPEDVKVWAAWTAHAVASGQIDARTAREISYALGQLRFAIKDADLARELAQLRAQVNDLKRK